MEHTYKVLTPSEFSGSVYGDWGYELDGVKSEQSYVSRQGAQSALNRKLDKLENVLN